MRIYRNEYQGDPGEMEGFTFFGSKREAVAHAQNRDPVRLAEPLDVPTKKKELIQFLNQYAGHPDNG